MTENEENNSFAKRFAKKNSDSDADSSSEGGGGFAGKYASENNRTSALGEKGKISQLASKQPAPKEAFSESGGIKSKSRTVNERSHADAARRSRSDLIYLVRGKDRGRSAWHYVLVDKEKREMFLAKSRTGSMDVADYGEILHSGWGENPPQEVVDKINEEFGL
ncbi:hypothetical protein IC220_03615 [Wolbachia endosymbiont of Pentalonia nigronervosa]|jgi:hypothetical protein|uniref:hypothetical protein n=1 Tax=Wolbachia endosymbiont of Pentalonia nigronervosa TaxID=1301914 RepID=UPI00165ED37E|nr:hypothetical protein [Wolbachia endosymbiont of Pentalonia nigronervosa]MBD0391543.1 hypothetical protein [Wolbachia endosymbiont of Pentalonia nigronervosa]